MPRKITMKDGKFQLTDDIIFVYEKTITKYGTGAKIQYSAVLGTSF